MRKTYEVDVVGAFDELDEEEDSDSVGFLAHPETVGRHHKGDMKMRVGTDSSFSRRATSALEKLTGWLPGNLMRRVSRGVFSTYRVKR